MTVSDKEAIRVINTNPVQVQKLLIKYGIKSTVTLQNVEAGFYLYGKKFAREFWAIDEKMPHRFDGKKLLPGEKQPDKEEKTKEPVVTFRQFVVISITIIIVLFFAVLIISKRNG